MTQAALAASLGVTPNTVARWERGVAPIGNPPLVRLALEQLRGAWTPSAAAPSPGYFPRELNNFVGREKELTALRNLLLTSRLVTLTGTGGVGKTRLALRLADAIGDRYADGTYLLELAPLNDPSLVPRGLAETLGIRQEPFRPVLETLERALAGRRVLVVLDNCEHMVMAAAELAARLLRTCPHLTLLATSREPLAIEGEQIWTVMPLPIPGPRASVAELSAAPSVELFMTRARLVRPDLECTAATGPAILEICRRVDGIPLAIELAAARSAVLSPAQLATRLDDRLHLLIDGSRSAPPRHQTMRATLEWSYGLLDTEEQQLFARLSVFAGGFSLEAAEAVCSDADLPRGRVLDCLTGLVRKSLLGVEFGVDQIGRYGMLETLRQFGRERLEQSGEAEALAERHAMYFMRLAQPAAPAGGSPAFRSPRARNWLDELQLEHDNLRAALGWLIETRAVDRALRLGGLLRAFWNQRDHQSEGRAWLERILALPGEEASASRAQALLAAGTLAYMQGDLRPALIVIEEAGRLCRQLDSPIDLTYALFRLGNINRVLGELVTARASFVEAIQTSRSVGQRSLTALCMHGFGWVIYDEGDFAEMQRLAEEALALSVADGWNAGVAMLTSQLGVSAWMQGRPLEARAHMQRAVAGFRKEGDRRQMAQLLAYTGCMAAERGDSVAARRALTESVGIHHQMGEHRCLAEDLEACAVASVAERRFEDAMRFAGAAAGLRSGTGLPPSPTDKRRLDSALAQARRALGRGAADTAWTNGLRLELDEAAQEIAALARDSQRSDPLTPRETEVAALVARGLTNRQVADVLVISERTAQAHVRNILARLGLSSRVQLAAWVLRTEEVIEGVLSPRHR